MHLSETTSSPASAARCSDSGLPHPSWSQRAPAPAIENGVDHRRDVLGSAKDIDDVDLDLRGDRSQVRIDLLAENLVGHRIDRNHSITGGLEIRGHPIRVPIRFWRATHDRDGPGSLRGVRIFDVPVHGMTPFSSVRFARSPRIAFPRLDADGTVRTHGTKIWIGSIKI